MGELREDAPPPNIRLKKPGRSFTEGAPFCAVELYDAGLGCAFECSSVPDLDCTAF